MSGGTNVRSVPDFLDEGALSKVAIVGAIEQDMLQL